ncbi:MAG: heme exporter protein CcmB [Fimbriimonadaceae bacterium]|nr:heme exporter protein CcmB [Fimbriimonadaceae bacterium]
MAISNSNWRAEVGAVFEKEWLVERRARTGWITAGLFGFVAVVAVALAGFGIKLTGSLSAGLLWVVWLFAATVALPRAFVAEEELGTANLLRLSARAHSVYWGKALFNLVQMSAIGLLIAVAYIGLVGAEMRDPALFLISVLGGLAALTGTVTFCSVLVAQAAFRGALVGAIALPMLLPLAALGVSSLRVALGNGFPEAGWQAAVGLVGYATLTFASGPYLFAAVWKS